MPFNVGENIGPYRIIEQLGQGGMATVYKAYHAALDRYVALKVLHPAFGEDPNFEARFRREARLVAKLEHPNIVPIYDYSEHEKQPFLVMKFIEGETLKARMARGPLAAGELTKIIETVGAALGYAHKTGILHRDIKPSNVLLATDGSIYLADFGLARIASAGESTLSGDMVMGTPQYISPEQAMGKKDLDEGTDIYSFGVMLYELVVGQVPFNADTPFSIIHDHIYTPLPIPRKINPNVPEPVERVLLKALSKERADRYASVADMVTAFKQAWVSAGVPMTGTTITMKPQAPLPPLPPAPTEAAAAAEPKAKKKRPRWMYVAGILLLLVCCLFVFIAARRSGVMPPAPGQATRTAAAQVEPTTPAPPAPNQTPVVGPFPVAVLIDDFEGAPPRGTLGWTPYFDEAADSKVECVVSSEAAHGGAKSLLLKFDVAANSWATCGIYFDPPVDWSAGKGISFFLLADRGGLPFRLDLYSGALGNLVTHFANLQTPTERVGNWVRIDVPWSDIRRAEWLENPGMPFDPVSVTGLSFGFSTDGADRLGGMLRFDDVSLLGLQAEEVTPDLSEAMQAAQQAPNDAYAQLRLALAYWDANRPRPAFETLTKAADLAGQDRQFFWDAARKFADREAWMFTASMCLRAAASGEPLPAEQLTLFHEAVYKAAANRDFKLYLDFERIARVDEPISLIAQARYGLHTASDLQQAREKLNLVKSQKPDMPEAALFEAELLFKEGRNAEARSILEGLLAAPATPPWVRALAEQALQKIPL